MTDNKMPRPRGRPKGSISKKQFDSFRDECKDHVKWKKIIRILNKLALGGFAYKNYNGVELIAQPNFECIKLLVTLVWGKEAPTSNDDKLLKDFLSIIKPPGDIVPGHKSIGETDTETLSGDKLDDINGSVDLSNIN